MRRNLVAFAALAALGWAATAWPGAAYADDSIFFQFPLVTQLGPSLWQYQYTLTIDTVEKINTSEFPTDAVLFDFTGLQGTPTFSSAVGTLSGTVSTPLLGTLPPPPIATVTHDLASVPNIDISFSGTAGPAGGTDSCTTTLGITFAGQECLGVLTADSMFGPGVLEPYAADAIQIHLPAGPDTHGYNGNDTLGPVPEPSSMMLLGPGLLGFAPLVRRRAKRKRLGA